MATRLPLAALQICERVDTIRVQELSDYGTHTDPSWAGPYGFGQPEGAPAPLLEPGVPTLFWGGMVRMLARILNVELDGMEEFCQRSYTQETSISIVTACDDGAVMALSVSAGAPVAGADREEVV